MVFRTYFYSLTTQCDCVWYWCCNLSMHILHLYVFFQVLTFLRCDRAVSAGVGDPQPCISFVLNKLLKVLKEGGITCSRLAVHTLLKKECSGHYSLAIAQPFLPDGSKCTTIPSKRSKSGCSVLKCIQIHKCVFEDATMEKLEAGKCIKGIHITVQMVF